MFVPFPDSLIIPALMQMNHATTRITVTGEHVTAYLGSICVVSCVVCAPSSVDDGVILGKLLRDSCGMKFNTTSERDILREIKGN